jgi:hypothetical protein
MGEIVIDDPHGFETVYSTDSSSPAAPYIHEYHPKSIADLFEIGLIPKCVLPEHVHAAYESGQRAGTQYVTLSDSQSPLAGQSADERRRFVETRSKAAALDTSLQVMASTLVRLGGYPAVQAELIARKVAAVTRPCGQT